MPAQLTQLFILWAGNSIQGLAQTDSTLVLSHPLAQTDQTSTLVLSYPFAQTDRQHSGAIIPPCTDITLVLSHPLAHTDKHSGAITHPAVAFKGSV